MSAKVTIVPVRRMASLRIKFTSEREAYIYVDSRGAQEPPEADMQAVTVKLPQSQRTPFSVEDILDPTKFTRKLNSAGEKSAEGGKPDQILFNLSNCRWL